MILSTFLMISLFLQSADSSANSDWIIVDRVVYTNNCPIPINPYSDSIKVHEKSFVDYAKPIIDSGGCVLPNEKMPELYVRSSELDSVSIKDYLSQSSNFPSGLQVMLSFQISWNGIIQKIIFDRYRGNGIESIDLDNLAAKMRATPYCIYGFPKDAPRVVFLMKYFIPKNK